MENKLICPKCKSDEIYFDRFVADGLKPWYCDDCGYENDSKESFREVIFNE